MVKRIGVNQMSPEGNSDHAEGRDFVVTFNRRVHWLIEVKASEDNLGTSLRYYTGKLRPHESLQLVLNLDRAQERSGIKILPLGKWLEELPFQTNTA
jgi:hypothetical protein